MARDRIIHAVCEDGREVVRYQRAGKWYIEPKEGARRLVTIGEAVEVAAVSRLGGGSVYYGQPGGSRFDSAVAREVVRRDLRRSA